MENQNLEKKSKGKLLQFLLLGFFIIAAPAISWYYLKSGFNYQKTAMGELRSYGTYPGFSLKTHKGHTLTQDSLANRIVVTGILTNDEKQNDVILEKMAIFHEQFDDRNDILFIAMNIGDNDQSSRIKDKNFADYPQCMVLASNELALSKVFKIPTGKTQVEGVDSLLLNPMPNPIPGNYPFLILSDTQRVVRNYYNINSGEEMKRLIEHLALLMPRTKPDKLKFNGTS